MDDLKFYQDAHKVARDARNSCTDLPLRYRLTGLVNDLWQRSLVSAPTVFEFAGRECLIDGVPIPSSSKGMPLAWFVIASHQHRLGTPMLEWFFQGTRASGSAVQTLRRAADDVERHSEKVAAAIRGIGTCRGALVIKGRVDGITCTSPMLARATRSVISA